MANRISIEVNYMLSKRINLLQLTIDCSAFFLFFLLINMQLLLLLWLIQKYEQVMRRWKGDMSEPRTSNYVLPEVLPFPVVSHSSRIHIYIYIYLYLLANPSPFFNSIN